jgi:hypothetical protein
MMRDPFARAAKSILGRLGKDALLRGAQAGKVHIEHGVEVYERHQDGESVFQRSIATIDKQFAPKHGDELVILASSDGSYSGAPEVTYRVQNQYQDNGYTVRRIVLPLEG